MLIDIFLVNLFFDINLFPDISVLKEHFHKLGLLIDQLTIVFVNEERLHDKFIESAEAVLARVKILAASVQRLPLLVYLR